MKDIANQLEGIIRKHKNIEKQLSNQNSLETSKLIELNKEYSDLTPIVEVINLFNKNKEDLIGLKDLLKEWISINIRYEKSGILTRLGDVELLDVMFSNIGYKSLCSILEAVQSVADIIIDSGNPFDLTDMICSANVSGMLTSIAILVFIIIIPVYYKFSWKLFGKDLSK